MIPKKKLTLNNPTRAQLDAWAARFSAYRHPPTWTAISTWFEQFRPQDRKLAAKILDNVTLIPEIDIQTGFRDALNGLAGWSRNVEDRAGRWFFVGYGGFGESGQSMLHKFREANNMTTQKWREFFVTTRDLPRLRLTAFDNVVFVDDFSGTGRQVTLEWPETEELVASEATCHLILAAATSDAISEIQRNTELVVSVTRTIEPQENIFAEANEVFTEADCTLLEGYGRKAWTAHPKGYGECGLLYILSHKTPNNTIPLLHINSDRWVGVFPRSLIKLEPD